MYLIKNQKQQHLAQVQNLLTEQISYTWLTDNQLLQMQSYHNKQISFVKFHRKHKLIAYLKQNWQKLQIDPKQNYTIVKHSIL